MTKYRVKVENLYHFEIEADSVEDARDTVLDMSDEEFNAGYAECSYYEITEENENA